MTTRAGAGAPRRRDRAARASLRRYGAGMHPIERLRFVARADGFDASTLAVEAADALGALAFDPRALVTSCRRLLDAHPDCGPLWWVAAHVLASPDPVEAASVVADLLACDDSAEELGGCLPAGAVVVAAPSETLDRALSSRPDVAVRYVGDAGVLRRALRGSDVADATGFVPDELDAALDGATLAVLEAGAAGPAGILVGRIAAHVAAGSRAASVPVWALLGIGTVLPGALFEACASRSAGPSAPVADADGPGGHAGDGSDAQVRDRSRLAFVAGEDLALAVTAEGPVETAEALRATDCPAPAELLSRSR